MNMAISDNLFLAILALDAYNRDNDNAPVNVSGNQLGNAQLLAIPNPQGYRDASFFAQAYQWSDSTVISYRGTDSISDVWNGWELGAGFSSASQADMARRFYEYVTGRSVFDTAPSNVIPT